MFGLALASAKPYLAAGTVGVRTGYSSVQYGSLSREPAAIAAQGSEVLLLDFRASSEQLRLHLSGDLTSYVVGKTLQVGVNTFTVTSATLDGGTTVMSWTPSAPNLIEDGKGYAVDFY